MTAMMPRAAPMPTSQTSVGRRSWSSAPAAPTSKPRVPSGSRPRQYASLSGARVGAPALGRK
eukprot:8067864-Alexandrium_andersonii.AAC.1